MAPWHAEQSIRRRGVRVDLEHKDRPCRIHLSLPPKYTAAMPAGVAVGRKTRPRIFDPVKCLILSYHIAADVEFDQLPKPSLRPSPLPLRHEIDDKVDSRAGGLLAGQWWDCGQAKMVNRPVVQDPGPRGRLHVDHMISKPLTPKGVICAYGFTTKYAARQVGPTASKAASK
jgi:hypothetical protein